MDVRIPYGPRRSELEAQAEKKNKGKGKKKIKIQGMSRDQLIQALGATVKSVETKEE
jgi:hypothetical protein